MARRYQVGGLGRRLRNTDDDGEERVVKGFSLAKFREQAVPGEEEIRAGWTGVDPVVSILCTSYNHEAYIEDALHGFLIQKTNFPFEIIIHDDVSTDNTRNIINRYAADYPGIIRTVFQTENQYSRGVKISLLAARHASGQYLAFCEGDDFWISADKLQTQVDAMQEYPASEMCFHSAVKLVHDVPAKQLFCKRAEGNRRFGVEPIIRCGGSFMPTASMLIRRAFFERAFQDKSLFFQRYLMGYFYQIFCSLAGGALYIDRPMAVYRSVSEGSWTQTILSNQDFYRKWLDTYLASLREADARTDYMYHADFAVPIRRCHWSVLNNTGLDMAFRREHFLNNRGEIGKRGLLLWILVSRFPIAHAFVRKLRLAFRKALNRG
jgi:glycosyltransferase involved in cell wall biosynthesis